MLSTKEKKKFKLVFDVYTKHKLCLNLNMML